jgi:hypothetical protein
MISAMAAPSFMTVSPWIARPVPSGRFETVGSGFGCGVKRARRKGMEVLICVLPPESAFRKITEMQAGEEFSCSQHPSERWKLVFLHRLAPVALRKHHSGDPSEAASRCCHARYGILDYLSHKQLHESQDRRLAR